MGEPEMKSVQLLSDDELKNMNLDKKEYMEMLEFNHKTVLQIHDHLPG